tara:strand:- start:55843 stop:57372 length:1530 start_codon:yes stop_codon:yes gene_type:complete
MKTITQMQILFFGAIPQVSALIGCTTPQTHQVQSPLAVHASSVVIESEPGTPRPPFSFSKSDNEFLDKIEHSTFIYFWEAVSPETGMVYDRSSSDVISIAGVGFQLASLPIGVERGWVTRNQASSRAMQILGALEGAPSNRKAGLFYHFINPHDASARRVGRELVVSTVDSALLFAGMLTAGEYFGGDIKNIADSLFAQANWSFFLASPDGDPKGNQYLSLGWKPSSDEKPTGEGELLPYFWLDSGDEHRLTTFLALCAPNPAFRVSDEVYWSLRRQLGWEQNQGHMVWFPYSGALFTAFFAHCFIDYSSLAIDDPASHQQTHRAQVDWWENSRRMVNLHRDRAIENPTGLPTLGPDAWGFSASDGPDSYVVSGQFPTPVKMIDAQPDADFSTYTPSENWGEGVIAPYAAGSSIMFEPELALKSLRKSYAVTTSDGGAGVWNKSATHRWGFFDAYRLDQDGHADWVAEDYVAISQGPLLLGIENARNGFIWKLFMNNQYVKNGINRAGM